jgi:hypothetical protein
VVFLRAQPEVAVVNGTYIEVGSMMSWSVRGNYAESQRSLNGRPFLRAHHL